MHVCTERLIQQISNANVFEIIKTFTSRVFVKKKKSIVFSFLGFLTTFLWRLFVWMLVFVFINRSKANRQRRWQQQQVVGVQSLETRNAHNSQINTVGPIFNDYVNKKHEHFHGKVKKLKHSGWCWYFFLKKIPILHRLISKFDTIRVRWCVEDGRFDNYNRWRIHLNLKGNIRQEIKNIMHFDLWGTWRKRGRGWKSFCCTRDSITTVHV